MAHLRHIALSVPDPEKTARFYEKTFGMKRVGTLDHDQASGVYLSDGVINAAGKIAAAGLDVYEREPAIADALMVLDNVVLAPHLGSATAEGRAAMGEKVLINIKTFVDGHAPPDRVLGPDG